MFYSHEVLTSRQYGVATIWLVATLGAKSTLKKVNRKAILQVDVPKACGAIMAPEAPMALRLQSNLLYGVVRVYSEQCGYMLVDVQNAQHSMQTLLRSVKVVEIEAKHKAKPDQLNLKEDSQFILDDLFNFELDNPRGFDFTSSGSSDPDSLLSPHGSLSAALGSEHDDSSIRGIDIPPSMSSSLGGVGGFSVRRSSHGGSGTGSQFRNSIFRREEDERLFDPGFAFDEYGNIVDAPIGGEEAALQQDLATPRDPTILSHHGEADVEMQEAPEDAGHRFDNDHDVHLPLQDDYDMYADAEAFHPPPPRQSVQRSSSPLRQPSRSAEPTESGSDTITEDAIHVPALRNRNKKVIRPDTEQELHNHDISEWSRNYLSQMERVVLGRIQARSTALAKKNANFWVLENGVGGLSTTFGQEAIPETLRMFTGHALLEAITGNRLAGIGEKHAREEGDEAAEHGVDPEGRRVRIRSDEDEVGRGGDDGDHMIDDVEYLQDDTGHMGAENRDETIEVGREAQTPLNDDHMSSTMPWNNTASIRGSSARLGGASRGFGSSVGGGGQFSGMGRMSSHIGSRMVSASPLRGRGDAAAAAFGSLDEQGTPGFHSGPMQDNNRIQEDEEGQNHHPPAMAASLDLDEQYQIYGPAAAVQTQEANQPAWIRAALDSESGNFFAYVQASIQEAEDAREAMRNPVEEEQNDDDDDDDYLPSDHHQKKKGFILFEDLLPPASNNHIVAAQGLLHVLTLATKKLLQVDQGTFFGPINLCIAEIIAV